LAAGINLIDTAPMYGACEAVIAATFAGVLPAGVRVTTKCQLGSRGSGTAAAKLEESLDASLEAMRLDESETTDELFADRVSAWYAVEKP